MRFVVKPVAATAAAAAYAWWATSLRPFTWAALLATIAGGGAAVAIGARWGKREPRTSGEGGWKQSGVWSLLVLALAGWELAAYVQQPRADHPTLSSLANELFVHHPVRALAMVFWLVIGLRLARR